MSTEDPHLSVLVALHSGSFSGIDTYAEQIAAAAATANHEVTLVGVGEVVRAELQRKAAGPRVRVAATRSLPHSAVLSAARRMPTLAVAEMRSELARTLRERGEWFDVAHLNHPALAPAVRPFAARVVVGAWFYPHSPGGRMVESWRHTGGRFPRSAGYAVKGLSHYWNDRLGYSASDCIVAPTEMLAGQLKSLGLNAVVCPPPSQPPATSAGQHHARARRSHDRRRITIICGDLSHPRKNVRAGIQAVRRLATAGFALELELIGRGERSLSDVIHALPASVDVLARGPLPREAIHDRLLESDVLLMPSLYEEWGYVVTEALLAGTAVVAFPVYPFIEILEPPLGTCARDLTHGALAQALSTVLMEGADRRFVAAAAARRFGAKAIGHRLTAIWAGTAITELDAPHLARVH